MPCHLQTCECGHTYVKGNPENEEIHNRLHDEFMVGPNIPEVQSLRCVTSKDSLRIVLADKSDKELVRMEVAKVAMVAQRSMPEYKAGYYGTDSEDSNLFALVDGTRIVGMVITSLEKNLWRFTWTSEDYVQIFEVDHDFVSRPKIARIWIAGSYRCRGLAKWLVSEVGKHLNYEIQDLGWEMPFTICGKSFVKSVCPEYFLGCGDSCPN